MAANNANPNEIHLIREYDAPVQAVWDAWTDPAQVAQWWGPRGFSITTHHKDLRVGGTWNYTMHGPDGTDYPNTTLYHEVVPNAKLVYDHGGYEDRPPLFRVTVTFTEKNGKTTLDMRMAHETPEAAEESRKIIKMASGNSTWDRLAEYLDKTRAGKETFVIARAFETSIETMYDLWADPEHVARWLPPTGFTMEYIRADIRPGGRSFYKMTDGNVTMYGSIEYREMRRPDRIEYTQQFRDAEERISRHPMAPTWPESMHTLVTFVAEAANRTRVTVTWTPEGAVSAEELAAFVNMRAGMTQGWTGSFDKLEAYVARGQ